MSGEMTFGDLLADLGDPRLAEVGLMPLALILGVSALASYYLAFLYVRFSRGRGSGSEIHHAFPLLGIAVTAIFVTVQFSLPLSLGLLGALSIVRFRTPVKEPEDIGFVLLVIATGLACATFSLGFLAIELAVATLALVVARPLRRGLRLRQDSGILLLDLPTADLDEHGDAIAALLGQAAGRAEIESIRRLGDEASLTYGLSRIDRGAAADLERRLRELSPSLNTDLVFHDG